jgi:predicted TIM-barrel fold metal-dependent hydrolase
MPFTIDVHHHILPDFFWRETNAADHPVGGITPRPWSKEMMFSFMDDAGIDVAITSISTPGVHMGNDLRARSLARRSNEFAADLIRAHPRCLGGFACLPIPDVDGALEEVRYSLDTLKLDGVVVFTNTHGIYLGDKHLEPVFTELERRKAVVFVHPTASPDRMFHDLGLPDSLIDFPTDTTRAVAHLHYSNRFAQTPNVKYIFSHAGGSIPYLAGRFAIIDEMRVIPGHDERGDASDTFRRLYWDTALAWNDSVLRCLQSVVTTERVLCGTDHPYIRRDIGARSTRDLRITSELDPRGRQLVSSGNALRLFPRFALN